MKKFKVLDLFSGIGGFSLGLERTAGFETVAFCEIDEICQKVLQKHWPLVSLFSNVKKLNSQNIKHKIDIITGGFPCFTEGTLILTKEGYRDIKDIKVGDEVLTHKGVWKRVNQKHKKRNARTRTIKSQGVFPLTTTDEHPFYVRGHEWVEAKNLVPKKHMLGMGVPEIYKTPIDKGYNFWWTVGRFIADGWLVNRKDRGDGSTCRVVICCSKTETEEIEKYLLTEFSASKVEERTVFKYHITQNWFGEFLKPIGRGAENKQIPSEWLHLPIPESKAILDGYFSGDGSVQKNRIRATTVSKKLALGVSHLVQKVYGVSASLYTHEVPLKKIIEGREVNQKTQYCVAFTPRSSKTSSIKEGRFVWKKLKENNPTNKVETVYNIGVEDDESYIANGCVVHNCQDISVAGKGAGLEGERSGLWFEYKRLIKEIQPKYAIIENVANLRSKGLATVIKDLGEIGYDVEWNIISARSVGGIHLRERIFLVAHTNDFRLGSTFTTKEEKQKWWTETTSSQRSMLQQAGTFEPRTIRADDGFPKRVDGPRRERIKQLGNAVVPQIVEWIGQRILDYEQKI